MRLSIIIPTRNRADELIRLIGALAAQREVPAVETIIVDDASDLPTRERVIRRVTELSTRGFAVRLICHDSQRGVSAARNAGVRAAAGDILCFFDDDILPAADYLARCRQVHEQHPEILVLNGQQRPLRRDLYSQYWHYYYTAAFDRTGVGLVYQIKRVSPGTLSIKRSLLERLDPLFDEALPSREDFDLGLRLHNLDIPVFKADDLVAQCDSRSTLRGFLNQRLWYARGESLLRQKHGAEKVAREEARLIAPNRLRFLPLQMLARIWLHIHCARA